MVSGVVELRAATPPLFVSDNAITLVVKKAFIVWRQASAGSAMYKKYGDTVRVAALLVVERVPISYIHKSTLIAGYIWVKSFHFISTRCAGASFSLVYAYINLHNHILRAIARKFVCQVKDQGAMSLPPFVTFLFQG